MNLDSLKEIKQIDRSNMKGSIELLNKQIRQTWDEIQTINLPQDFSQINKIVFSGMGGSALGAYVFKHLYGPTVKLPFEIINDYHLPFYADENTLVITASYSGTTEETISCLKETVAKKAKTIVVATGGTLEDIALKNDLVFYKLKPQFNPCNQPRMGIGYSIFAILVFFARLNLISISEKDIQEIDSIINLNNKKYGVVTLKKDNLAKQTAHNFLNKIPIFIAGEFLLGSVHAIRNQINENAKSLALYFPLPELNHHLLEALRFPSITNETTSYFFFQSDLYSPKIAKRVIVTSEIIQENGRRADIMIASSKTKLGQTIEMIHFGSYVGYYLALLYGIDPSLIKWVDLFKKKIAS